MSESALLSELSVFFRSSCRISYGHRSGLRRTVRAMRLRRLPDCGFMKIISRDSLQRGAAAEECRKQLGRM